MKKLVKSSIIVLLRFAAESYVAFCVLHQTVFLTQTFVGAALAVYVLHIKYRLIK